MEIDSSYIKDILIPILTLLLPVAISVVKWWLSSRTKGRDNRRNPQFDAVSSVKRLAALSRIQALRDKPQDGMVPLQIKALYESIGIRLPVWVAHQLMDYLGRTPVSLNSLGLNCFLRRISLTVVKDGIFSLDANRLRWQRISTLIFLLLSALAIGYGFYVTVLPLGEREATAGNALWFFFFFFAYAAMAVFVVVWSMGEWGALSQASDFWRQWQPHLCQTEVEYQARLQNVRNAAEKSSATAVVPAFINDMPPIRKPQRGWLTRRLNK